MKHTKRKYSKTRRCKKRRNCNKTNKIPIINKKQRKTRKQRGSGKYADSDIYNIDQFSTNDCLNILKSNPNRSESGILNKTFNSKKNDPYVKCRRSIAVLNTEKMPPDEYLKYRKIIEKSKEAPYYNPERGDVEKIGKKYIFDYIFKLYGNMTSETSKLTELLKVISPYYLIHILTYQSYVDYLTRLQEISQMNRRKGRIFSSVGPTLKTFTRINGIYQWVKHTNFELFKLNSPQDLINLFNSYYPINCPYRKELNNFDRINITATQVEETSTRYINNSSWDLYLDITFDNFYSDHLSKSKYDFEEVYPNLFGESFDRPLSTNIVDSNGEIVFKSTDCYKDRVNGHLDNVVTHFNNFILKLNDVGGATKFEPEPPAQSTNVKRFEYDQVSTNQFIVNIVKFLAASMYPFLSYVTKIKLRPNYYGLFYRYYEENRQRDNISFEENINFEYVNMGGTPLTEIEVDTINRFINKHIPDNNYEKCVRDLRKHKPDDLFPSCRIIDVPKNVLFTFHHFMIIMPLVTTTPRCTVGHYFHIMKFNNINDIDVENNNITAHGLILWGGNMNENASADIPTSLTSSVYKQDTLDKIVHKFVGNTFYNGFIQPIFSSLQKNTSERTDTTSNNTTIPRNTSETSSVRSSASTPRNTMAPIDMPTFGVRDSVESVGSEVTLG